MHAIVTPAAHTRGIKFDDDALIHIVREWRNRRRDQNNLTVVRRLADAVQGLSLSCTLYGPVVGVDSLVLAHILIRIRFAHYRLPWA